MMDRYDLMLEKANVSSSDRERRSLFWILCHNTDLYSKINHIYDFEEDTIKISCLESNNIDFPSSSIRLIRLAFNLYNGYPADVSDSLFVLDDENFESAMKAIRIRFNKLK